MLVLFIIEPYTYGTSPSLSMQSITEEKSGLASGFSAAAKAMAATPMVRSTGRGKPCLVRMTPAVEAMLDAAKAPRQNLAEYLREAGVTVALQRLESNQS